MLLVLVFELPGDTKAGDFAAAVDRVLAQRVDDALDKVDGVGLWIRAVAVGLDACRIALSILEKHDFLLRRQATFSDFLVEQSVVKLAFADALVVDVKNALLFRWLKKEQDAKRFHDDNRRQGICHATFRANHIAGVCYFFEVLLHVPEDVGPY